MRRVSRFRRCSTCRRGRLSVLPRVDFRSADTITVPVLFHRRSPSIAASEAGAGCGARQLASRWSAGRRRGPSQGPRAPGPPPPSERTWVPESWRGPADRKAGPGERSQAPPAPPGAPTPLFEGKEKHVPARRGRDAGQPRARKIKEQGRRSVGCVGRRDRPHHTTGHGVRRLPHQGCLTT